MAAMSNTAAGKALNEAHIQIYGWVNFGGNVSTNTVKPGGNWPAAYMYTPNTAQLDQAVVYIERLPDTVQKDHVDWGFRFSAMYGENYRYTTAYGLASYQLLNHNLVNGYDFPMVYGEIYIPFVAEGLLLRFGRFISLPDIEAQLAPNNLMYSHSMAYTFDNYTNTGLQATLALTKNWFVQLGVTVGTEAMPWHWGQTVPNPFPNVVFPGTTMPTDPGARPSVTGCVRYQTDSAYDNVYVCADAINNGTWGYNNLQWYGMTWYHKFTEKFHVAFEVYTLSQRNVLNITDPAGIIAGAVIPLLRESSSSTRRTSHTAAIPTRSRARREWSLRSHTGTTRSRRWTISRCGPSTIMTRKGSAPARQPAMPMSGLGWQHWFSPQIEMRPEVTYYKSYNAPAFNGNFNATPVPIAPNKYYMWLFAGDVIWHF